MKTISGILSLLSVVLLTGCVTGPTIDSAHDQNFAPKEYARFALLAPEQRASGAWLAVKPTIEEALLSAFTGKGYTLVDDVEQADFTVAVRGKLVPRIDLIQRGYPQWVSYGRRSWYVDYPYGGTDVVQWDEGTLTIEVYEAKSRQLVWAGWAKGETKDRPNLERVRSAVEDIISRFPLREAE